eukprot:6488642-Pyramimonas_sp.AAC.1
MSATGSGRRTAWLSWAPLARRRCSSWARSSTRRRIPRPMGSTHWVFEKRDGCRSLGDSLCWISF